MRHFSVRTTVNSQTVSVLIAGLLYACVLLTITPAHAQGAVQIPPNESCTDLKSADAGEIGLAWFEAGSEVINAEKEIKRGVDKQIQIRKEAHRLVEKLESDLGELTFKIIRNVFNKEKTIRDINAKIEDTKGLKFSAESQQKNLEEKYYYARNDRDNFPEEMKKYNEEKTALTLKVQALDNVIETFRKQIVGEERELVVQKNWIPDDVENKARDVKTKIDDYENERRRLVADNKEVKENARMWLNRLDCVTALQTKPPSDLDQIAASKAALKQIWGQAVSFAAMAAKVDDRYNAEVNVPPKYYRHSIFVFPIEELEKSRQAFARELLLDQRIDQQNVIVEGLGPPIVLYSSLDPQSTDMDVEHIPGSGFNVVASRHGTILCGNVVIHLEHFQDTKFNTSQERLWDTRQERYEKHPGMVESRRLRPQVNIEAERYVRELVAALLSESACGSLRQ